MGRQVPAGSIIYAQPDMYVPATSKVRQAGIQSSSLQVVTFVNNARQAWSLMDGTLVQDADVSAGKVYFNEVVGSSGFYSVRFFPDRVGFWRVILQHQGLQLEWVMEYDVLPAGAFSPSGGGLIASFVKP